MSTAGCLCAIMHKTDIDIKRFLYSIYKNVDMKNRIWYSLAEENTQCNTDRMTGSGETGNGAEGERVNSQAKGPGHDDAL